MKYNTPLPKSRGSSKNIKVGGGKMGMSKHRKSGKVPKNTRLKQSIKLEIDKLNKK